MSTFDALLIRVLAVSATLANAALIGNTDKNEFQAQ
jgi:hypothetical protein